MEKVVKMIEDKKINEELVAMLKAEMNGTADIAKHNEILGLSNDEPETESKKALRLILLDHLFCA